MFARSTAKRERVGRPRVLATTAFAVLGVVGVVVGGCSASSPDDADGVQIVSIPAGSVPSQPDGGSDAASSSSDVAGSAPSAADTAFIGQIRPAIAAVEAELGPGQRYFEVTASAGFVNVFVAVDDATAAIPYLYFDGELQPPAPLVDGASGATFGADDVAFDETTILDQVTEELPTTAIDALSVYGADSGVTYVLAATSSAGGGLDIVVGPSGSIVSVEPR